MLVGCRSDLISISARAKGGDLMYIRDRAFQYGGWGKGKAGQAG